MPYHVEQALGAAGLRERYDQRPWYQRNDYLGWIDRAQREDTKAKRLRQMLDELRAGDLYMKMPWRPKRKGPS
ncbi:YdeI/OmpD-associated family protein [Limimaricola soesokkakensis]|nr:YdeI/OmpD-associated family protein [Limimaricola soesokkakensis]